MALNSGVLMRLDMASRKRLEYLPVLRALWLPLGAPAPGLLPPLGMGIPPRYECMF